MKKCESCGMPLDKYSTSKFDTEYCVFCQSQSNGGLKTKAEVRIGSIGAAMSLLKMSRADAEKMADELLPTLPRWKK